MVDTDVEVSTIAQSLDPQLVAEIDDHSGLARELLQVGVSNGFD
jgi:hypothetical protein